MTETKFTPGPWYLCAHLKDINEEIGCSCGYRGVIYGPEDVGYAICQPGHETYTGEEGLTPPRYDRMTEIANAHLIAAAPDLFKALDGILDELELLIDSSGDGVLPESFIREAKQAIAKARGEV